MRTTVDIPDSLYRELKSKAAKEGITVKKLILRGVEVELHASGKPARKKLELPLLESNEPGTLHLDNERIFEIISFP
jgi:hypothetical protein